MAFKSALDDLFKGKSLSFNGASASSDTTAAKVENGENMKSKILETWNNIRYDMKSGTSLKKDSPLWLLGKCYHTKQVFSTDTSHNADDSSDHSNGHPLHLKMFLKDLGSKPWFTYRKGFAPLNGTGMKLTSDTGWGCMLRTAQMMVAQSLITHLLGREWRLSDQHILEQTHLHRSIITWFLDEKNVRCPFSIHQLTEIGVFYCA
uniref:Cysteine protease n=1 Tax=Ciona savignyi TaxID=51511 RepID=H2Z7H5_CIOSA